MNRFSPSQLLGLLLLTQATLEVGVPLNALRSFQYLEPVAIIIGLLTLAVWALLVASGLGLYLKKRWALPCMFGFTALTPVAMLPFVPLVMQLFVPGNVSFLVGMLVVNFLIIAFADYLVRRERRSQGT